MTPAELHESQFKTLKQLGPPRVSRVVAAMLTFTAVGTALFLAFVPWVQTTYGAGTVTAIDPTDRLQEINALVQGRIQEWYVRDGSHVSTGDPIVRITDNDPLLIERVQAERDLLQAKLRAAEQALATAEIDLRRQEELLSQGLVARREFEQANIKVESLRGGVADAAAGLTRADTRLSRQSVQVVRAPRDGVILRLNAGDAATYISAGTVVATFVPDNVDRAIALYIDGRDVALVKQGSKARLQFEGWPAVQFSGWPSVSVGTFGGVVLSVDPSAEVTGQFRVLIAPDEEEQVDWPDQRFVRFGAKVRGWIQLERVTVGYEVWRQLNNFPPDLGRKPAGDKLTAPGPTDANLSGSSSSNSK